MKTMNLCKAASPALLFFFLSLLSIVLSSTPAFSQGFNDTNEDSAERKTAVDAIQEFISGDYMTRSGAEIQEFIDDITNAKKSRRLTDDQISRFLASVKTLASVKAKAKSFEIPLFELTASDIEEIVEELADRLFTFAQIQVFIDSAEKLLKEPLSDEELQSMIEYAKTEVQSAAAGAETENRRESGDNDSNYIITNADPDAVKDGLGDKGGAPLTAPQTATAPAEDREGDQEDRIAALEEAIAALKADPVNFLNLPEHFTAPPAVVETKCEDRPTAVIVTCACDQIMTNTERFVITRHMGYQSACGQSEEEAYSDASRKCNAKNPYSVATECFIKKSFGSEKKTSDENVIWYRTNPHDL